MARNREKSSTAAPGGFWTRSKASTRRSMPCRMSDCCRASSAWSQILVRSCPTRVTNIFRRVLCDIVGQDVMRGELPNDDALLGRLIRDICYANAKQYLQLPSVPTESVP